MPRRNPELTAHATDPYVDAWTPVHFLVGVLLGVLLHELLALILLVLWEPFVLMVLAPRIQHGRWGLIDRTQLTRPTLRNVLVDLVADVTGVIVGVFLLRALVGIGPLFG